MKKIKSAQDKVFIDLGAVLRHILKVIASIAVAFQLNGLTAQSNPFITLTPKDGNGSWITDLKVDRRGYLWIASTGLTCYDGYTWKTYTTRQVPFGSNSIESICPTADGNIWVGTKGQGLDYFNPATEQVTHYHLEGRTNGNMEEEFITVLLEGRDGTLWVGTHNGLYSRNRKGKFIHYKANPLDPHGLSHSQVRSIYEDRQGMIWIGTGEPGMTQAQEGGLNRLDRKTGRFTQYKANSADPHSLVDNRVRAIFEDSQGTFWVGTFGDGLHTMDRKTGRFTRYPYHPAHPEILSRPYSPKSRVDSEQGISFIREDLDGNLWIGAHGGGLLCYNLTAKQTTRFLAEQTNGIEDNLIWASCLAPDGTMCFGTTSGQLLIHPKKTQKIQIPFNKSAGAVQAIHRDAAGQIWLGTFSGLFIQKSLSDLKTTRSHPMEVALKNFRINSIFEDKQQRIWVGTFNEGIFRYDPKANVISHYQHDSAKQRSLSNNLIAWINQSRDGTIWIPTAVGLDQWNPQNEAFSPVQLALKDRKSMETTCMTVLEDHKDNLWIGTYSGGLKKWNRQTGTLKNYLKGEGIWQLLEDSNKVLWVVTGEGTVYYYQAVKDQFFVFNPVQSFKPLVAVKSIIEDNQHNLWLGSRVGIFRVNPERTMAFLFDESFGFKDSESVYYASVFKSPDGKLYFGGSDGVFHFYPKQMEAIQFTKPPLFLNALSLNNKPVLIHPEGPLTEPIDQVKNLHLNYHQSNFSIGFVSPSLESSEQIQYQYKLDNYDLDWRIGTENKAEYFKVPAGKYVFRVRVAKPGSAWAERSLVIIVSPPWWQSWWAYGLYLILFLAGIGTLIQYRSITLQRQNRVLEEKVALRTNQLQKSLETLKSTQSQLIQSEKLASLGELTAGIAHEIQNPLNFVNNFAEVSAEMLDEMHEELKKGDTTEAIAIATDLKTNLEKINHHGQRASSIVKGMLEHSRASTGVKEPTDLNALADEFLRLAYHGLRAKDNNFNATLETHFDPDLPLVSVIPQDIGRVLLNLINNAFYAVHQHATTVETLHATSLQYQPMVTISTQRIGDQILIKVKDNGPGIPESIRDKIFQPFFTTKPTGQGTGLGLSLAYDIVTKGHGGNFSVDSIEGEGTKFIISLPTLP